MFIVEDHNFNDQHSFEKKGKKLYQQQNKVIYFKTVILNYLEFLNLILK